MEREKERKRDCTGEVAGEAGPARFEEGNEMLERETKT